MGQVLLTAMNKMSAITGNDSKGNVIFMSASRALCLEWANLQVQGYHGCGKNCGFILASKRTRHISLTSENWCVSVVPAFVWHVQQPMLHVACSQESLKRFDPNSLRFSKSFSNSRFFELLTSISSSGRPILASLSIASDDGAPAAGG